MDKEKQKDIFSNYFSIHKRKKISKNINRHYILAKIIHINRSKKNHLTDQVTDRGLEHATGMLQGGKGLDGKMKASCKKKAEMTEML